MRLDARKLTAICLMAGLIVVIGAGAATAKKKKALEEYRAQAYNINRGAAGFLDIVIYRWTTPEQRAGIQEAFRAGGNEALYDALDDQEQVGYVRAPASLGYEMKYAWQFEADGKRHVILGTDRTLGFLEVARSTWTEDYNISFVYLVLDLETGEGEGQAVGGAEFSIDEATGKLEVTTASSQPTKLTKVKRRD